MSSKQTSKKVRVILASLLVGLLFCNFSNAVSFDCKTFLDKAITFKSGIERNPGKVLQFGESFFDSAIAYKNCEANKAGGNYLSSSVSIQSMGKDIAGNSALLYYHSLLTMEESNTMGKLQLLSDTSADYAYLFSASTKSPFTFISQNTPADYELLYLKFLQDVISDLESDSFGWQDGNLIKATKVNAPTSVVTYEVYHDFREFLFKKLKNYLKLSPESISDIQQTSALLDSAMLTPSIIIEMEKNRMARLESGGSPFLNEKDYDKALRSTADELANHKEYVRAMQTLSFWLASFKDKNEYRGLAGVVLTDLDTYSHLESETAAKGLYDCFKGLASVEGVATGALFLAAPEIIAVGATAVFTGIALGHSFDPAFNAYYGVDTPTSEVVTSACSLAFAALGAKYSFSKVGVIASEPLRTPFLEAVRKISLESQLQKAFFKIGDSEATVNSPSPVRLKSAVDTFGKRVAKSLCPALLEGQSSTSAEQSELFFAGPCPFVETSIKKMIIPEEINVVSLSELQKKGGVFVIPGSGNVPIGVRVVKMVYSKGEVYYEVEPGLGQEPFLVLREFFNEQAKYVDAQITPELYNSYIAEAVLRLKKSTSGIGTERSVRSSDFFNDVKGGKISVTSPRGQIYVGLDGETAGGSGGQVRKLYPEEFGNIQEAYRKEYGMTVEFDLKPSEWIEKYDGTIKYMPKVKVVDYGKGPQVVKLTGYEEWLSVSKKIKVGGQLVENKLWKVQLEQLTKQADAFRKYKANLIEKLESEGKTPEAIFETLNKLGETSGIHHLTVEVVLPQGESVPLSEIKGVRVDTSELRTKVIEELNKNGISVLKGKPVTEAVIVAPI